MTDYTLVYSSASAEALEKMVNEFLYSMNIPLKINDLFVYGVFCRESTYAFFKNWDEVPSTIEIPSILTNVCNKPNTKLEYVTQLIHDICFGYEKKPEWMIYIEMEAECTEYDLPPSTFLYIFPKKEEYNKLANTIIKFLYSPNLLITMIND